MDPHAGRRSVQPPEPGEAVVEDVGTGEVSREEINLRVMQPLAWYLRDHHGEQALERVAAACAVTPWELTTGARWVSYPLCESLLAEAMEILRDEDLFRTACTYRLKESSGPMRLLMLAVSPSTIYARTASTEHLVSSVGRYSCVSGSGSSVRMTYSSPRNESRLMCQSRVAQLVVVPTLCGLAPAEVIEGRCISRGDPVCEYFLRWRETGRWLPVFLGLGAGLVLGAGAAHLGAGALAGYVTLPALGGVAGYAYELRKMFVRASALGDEIDATVRLIAREDAEARREILEFHQRQREWSRLLEEQVADRTRTMLGSVERIQNLQEARVSTLRGFSHDLRNPLSALKLGLEWLRKTHAGEPEGEVLLGDLERAAAHMEKLLAELMETVISEAGIIRVTPQRVEVAPLADQLRRRLRALVHGRDIRVSAFATREVPESIETDPLLFDRVVDNLLTNAAKYTDRGSIVIEVDGTPGFLTIKVSDTGRGIPDNVIDRIFQPRTVGTRGPHSYGVGLSVVVQLLAQIGGRIEVMSRPGVGSTFWVHVPERVRPLAAPAVSAGATTRSERPRDQVVTIRRKAVN